MRKWFLVCMVMMGLLSGCSGLTPGDKLPQEKKQLIFLNSILDINILDQGINSEKVMEQSRARLQQIEEEMSLQSSESEVSRINANAGIGPVEVSEDTYYVIEQGIKYGDLSQGKFDVTIGKIVELWGIGTSHEKVPSVEELNQAVALVDYGKIVLQPEQRTVFLKEKGMVIDLGGIAKGFAADELNKILTENGITKAIINLGGNVYIHGDKDGVPFKVGIQNPFQLQGSTIGIYQAANESVVTSGVYERFFEKDGKRYHHIFSTETGWPVENDLVSVTIITPSSLEADALSTTVFALGLEKGMALVESLDQTECILITEDKKVYVSTGAKEKLEITDSSFISP